VRALLQKLRKKLEFTLEQNLIERSPGLPALKNFQQILKNRFRDCSKLVFFDSV